LLQNLQTFTRLNLLPSCNKRQKSLIVLGVPWILFLKTKILAWNVSSSLILYTLNSIMISMDNCNSHGFLTGLRGAWVTTLHINWNIYIYIYIHGSFCSSFFILFLGPCLYYISSHIYDHIHGSFCSSFFILFLGPCLYYISSHIYDHCIIVRLCFWLDLCGFFFSRLHSPP